MILRNKNIVIMGIRNKWSIAWGAAQSAYEQGANVIFTYHPSEDLEKLNRLIGEIPNSKAYPCDAGSDQSIKEVFSQIKKDYKKIDGVLHSIAHANTEDLRNPFIETSREGFLHANNISAYSLVAICKYAKEILNERGSIVTLTYYGSTKVMENYNVMGVAKAALEASVRYLADNMGEDKIRVNAVSAGPIKTLSAKGIKDFNRALDIVEKKAPLHENVTTKEVGDVVSFLFSNMSDSITGQVIYADKGYNIMG